MTNHPNRSKTHEAGLSFGIKSKASGKYLSYKAGIFGCIGDARKFSSRKSAIEMRNSCVHVSHWYDFEVVQID